MIPLHYEAIRIAQEIQQRTAEIAAIAEISLVDAAETVALFISTVVTTDKYAFGHYSNERVLEWKAQYEANLRALYGPVEDD